MVRLFRDSAALLILGVFGTSAFGVQLRSRLSCIAILFSFSPLFLFVWLRADDACMHRASCSKAK